VNEFGLHISARGRWQEMRQSLSRRMSAVRDRKCIVHVDITERGERLRKRLVVLFFAGVKPGVFQH